MRFELARPDGCDPRSTVRSLAYLPGDPTVSITPGGFSRATITPTGAAAIRVTWGAESSRVDVEATGPGAGWLAERAGALLGFGDDDAGRFDPDQPVLRELRRRHRGDRMPRTSTLWHDLAWFVVQQRVSTVDAARQWAALVRRFGSPVEGTSEVMAPPDAATIAGIGYEWLHDCGIERRRAEHLRAIARVVDRLEPLVDRPVGEAMPVLMSVPGIGPWTAGNAAAQTWGDPDAVILGDYGLPSAVAWVLAGEHRADDARMLELLEPHRGHRHRVVRLVQLSGLRPPRRHHRGALTDIRGW